ncbi:flippase-like domain-containing protein [Candidatus Saccharibacteria bacterium]|nr:flippase-like domain-containing protein [Candidatus Saccharibacteria bacterium]
MSVRGWLTIITLLLLSAVVYFGWSEIERAWMLMGSINLWILALILPIQFISYYATGSMIFSYLRAKGNLKHMSHMYMTRLSLELNFVNHILPSGGAAGFSYLAWILSRHGVSAGRATMAQVVRFFLTFVTFTLMLLVAFIILILDHSVDRNIALLSGMLIVLLLLVTGVGYYVMHSRARLVRFAERLARVSTAVVGFFSRRGKGKKVASKPIVRFFLDIHDDYEELSRDKKILWRPFLWSLVANVCDVALLYVAFLALGVSVSPAVLIIAFGLSSVASAVSVTPGGTGVYEAIMIAFLSSVGVRPDIAIAGTLLARVLLLAVTIVAGYAFYQLTILKYGKHTNRFSR